MTLYTCLVKLSKVAAPMIPFMAEQLYQNLVRTNDKQAPESVHLCEYPVADESMIDPALEERMDEVLRVVALGRACRNAASVKTRQPIGNMYVKAEFDLPDYFLQIIEEELNVKTVTFSDSVRAYTTYTFKPQLRTVGPKYGKYLGGIRTALAALDGNAAMDEIEATGKLMLTVGDEVLPFEKEDLLIEMTRLPGYESVSENGVTVVLDTNLTAELLEEGMVNELVSKVQNMRKDSGFEVTDHITLGIAGNEKVADILRRNETSVTAQVLADAVTYGSVTEAAREWSLNGEKVSISVTKI
jgi:isoleucyl-tRNA synthetase